jgi:signal peptide peptidase SppA
MRSRSLLHILAEIQERPWAITQAAMETILGIVERTPVDVEAVAARIGKPLENTGGRVEMHGNVAVIGVEGPLFRYASIFTEISGATSIENLSRDYRAALDNPAVHQIVLNVNSPGGQVDGINEFADQIRAGAAKKPVTAYVDGQAGSGGYWLASAASRIVANESAFLGSIGVVVSVTDNRDAQERQGVKRYEIVSTKSPLKRTDVRTDEGRAQLLAIADSIADLFIGRVSQFRGTTADRVTSDFGRGAMLPARQAIAAGMADALGSFETLITGLAAETAARPIPFPISAAAPAANLQEAPMADPQRTDPPAPAASPAATAAPNPVTSNTVTFGTSNIPIDGSAHASGTITMLVDPIAFERQRIAAILNCEEAQGRENLARTLALETDHDLATCQKILKAAPVAGTPRSAANPLAAAMQGLQNPTVGVGSADQDTPAAEAERVLAFVPQARRFKAS